MCGIFGFISASTTKEESLDILNKMSKTLINRGPDQYGYWHELKDGIAIGQRRLSIIDLSENGKQPMISKSGRYVITFNGMIYNFRELKKELNNKFSINWAGTSDTEVLLESISNLGLRNTLSKITGMFAMGVWDRKEKELFLIRDRAGEKPLFYAVNEGSLIFGSELKAVQKHNKFSKNLNIYALNNYFRFGYISSPETIWENCYHVPPGSIIKITLDNIKQPFEEIKYWELEKVKNKDNFFNGSFEDATNKLDFLMQKAIKNQLISDVPLGAFLSGGVDSSFVVALMKKLSNSSVETFSVGFKDSKYNEAYNASEVAKYLNTSHNEFYVEDQDIVDVIPELSNIYDQPFADSSAIPTILISKIASSKVKVVLTGDGSDEIFGGYDRYSSLISYDKILNISPKFILNIANKINEKSFKFIEKSNFLSRNLLPFNTKLIILNKLSRANNYKELCQLYSSHFESPPLNTKYLIKKQLEKKSLHYSQNLLKTFIEYDFLNYLPSDILTKVDRASMCSSLESRTPFLDHNVIEFAWSLPNEFLINHGVNKYLLKNLLYRYVPKNLVERPKMGFAVPIEFWLRSSLKEWGNDLISDACRNDNGILNSKIIKSLWDQFQNGKPNMREVIWSIIMWQDWSNKNSFNLDLKD